MDVDKLVNPLIVKDLRIIMRNRGLQVGGGVDELKLRLKDHMRETGNYSVAVGQGDAPTHAGSSTADMHTGTLQNNYARPGGQQNVGNFLTDKPSSRVLAPPGGGSQIMFGDYSDPHTQRAPQQQQAPPPRAQGAPMGTPWGNSYDTPSKQAPSSAAHQQVSQAPFAMDPNLAFGKGSQGDTSSPNNYARPGGQQNVGNYLTNRPSSRVLAPPGGASQISFG